MQQDMTRTRIGFIGGGNMAQAMIRGLLASGHAAECITVAEPDDAQRGRLQSVHAGLVITADNAATAAAAELLVLAVKPQVMGAVAQGIARVQRPANQVLMSVAAGITLEALQGWFGAGSRLVRAMPNTPALVGEGMTGLYAAGQVDERGRSLANYVMAATGQTVWLDAEELLDCVTALSGSGPAYFFLLMEILQEVGEELGLEPAIARLLSTQTALGAGKLAAMSDDTVSRLRERVTSPGGTTAAALQVLAERNLRAIVRDAVLAAHRRSVELGRAASSSA